MKSPRIGIDVTSALTQGGGIGRYTRELVRALAAIDSPLRYTLFHARVPQEPPVPNPLPEDDRFIHRPASLSERWLYRMWYRLRVPLPVQFFTGKLDLYHSPDFVLPPTAGGIPTLLTVHDLSFVHFPDTFPASLVNYLNQVVPRSAERATHIVADSKATRDDLMNFWSIPGKKITVLYSGVSSAYQPVEDKELVKQVRRTYGLGDRPYILSVGTLQPRKNYGLLIRAFAAIAHNHAHNLAIAGGKGWLEEEMLAEATHQGVADRVQFLGFVADNDLPALYTGADLFAFPSLYEGFGLPILEAMACGAPVISSNASSLPEVCGDAALLLQPESQSAWSGAMQRLLGDTVLRSELRQKGIVRAGQFEWRSSADQLLKLYKTLLDKAATTRHN